MSEAVLLVSIAYFVRLTSSFCSAPLPRRSAARSAAAGSGSGALASGWLAFTVDLVILRDLFFAEGAEQHFNERGHLRDAPNHFLYLRHCRQYTVQTTHTIDEAFNFGHIG